MGCPLTGQLAHKRNGIKHVHCRQRDPFRHPANMLAVYRALAGQCKCHNSRYSTHHLIGTKLVHMVRKSLGCNSHRAEHRCRKTHYSSIPQSAQDDDANRRMVREQQAYKRSTLFTHWNVRHRDLGRKLHQQLRIRLRGKLSCHKALHYKGALDSHCHRCRHSSCSKSPRPYFQFLCTQALKLPARCLPDSTRDLLRTENQCRSPSNQVDLGRNG